MESNMSNVTTQQPMTQLEPCPFCGDYHAELIKTIDDYWMLYFGEYKDEKRKLCKLFGFGMARYGSREDAIADWNTRADRPDPELAEVRKALSLALNESEFVGTREKLANAKAILDRKIGGA